MCVHINPNTDEHTCAHTINFLGLALNIPNDAYDRSILLSNNTVLAA